MNGAELLVKCLERQGVERVWGYPGGAIMPVYDALLDSPIRHFLTRHEQAASFAAQGFARVSGEVGVCLATSGPGATNLLTGIADAFMDSVPLVAITGQVPQALIGTDAFQEVDILGMSLPVVKHNFLLDDPERIPETVQDAFRIAQSGRPGPVLIDFPKDVALAEVARDPVGQRPMLGVFGRAEDAPLAEAQQMLKTAAKPLIYAGGGVRMGNAFRELRAFVERTGIPVVHTLHGLGGVPGDHPLFLGMLGMHGTRAANHAVQNCDLLIALGARFDDRVTGKLNEFAPEAAVIHVDLDPAELGKLRQPTVGIQAPLEHVLPRLDGTVAPCPNWLARCQKWKTDHAWQYAHGDGPIDAPGFLQQLSQRAPADTYVCCDVGQHQMWVAQHYCFRDPRRHLTSGGLGTMGFGLPAAIGVQCTYPEATVINVSGDGSIMMNLQELATLCRYGLPVKIVLLDNSALGMVRQWQELFFENRESEVDLTDNPDFSAIARSFGICARTIGRRAEIGPAIGELFASREAHFLRVLVDRKTNVWPLVPPGANNEQMLEA